MSKSPPTQSRPSENESTAQHTVMKRVHPVDARLTHISDNILPTAPYYLSCERAVSSRHVQRAYPHTANSWIKGTHFEPDEVRLQYMTFLDRSRDGSITGMQAQGGWDDGNGAIAPEEDPNTRSSSLTPLTGPKKKISLAEYKEKERNKALDKSIIAGRGKIESIAKLNGESNSMSDAVKPELKAPSKGQKRSIDTMTARDDFQGSIEQSHAIPPAKKARTNVEASPVILKESNMSVSKEVPKPTAKGSHMPAAESSQKLVSTTSHKLASKEPHKPVLEESNMSVLKEPHKSVLKAARPITKTSATVPSALKAKKPKVPSLPPMLSPLASDIEDELAKINTQAIKPIVPDVAKKLRLRVTLKIKKKYRKTLNSYLSLDPTPGRYPRGIRQEPHAETTTSATKTTATTKTTQPADIANVKRIKPEISKSAEKRRRSQEGEDEPEPSAKRTKSEIPKPTEKRRRSQEGEEEPEPSTKRHKVPGWIPQKTHTPKGLSTGSSTVSQLKSATKAHTNVSELGPRSTPMQRGLSGEGVVHTPQRPTSNNTPSAPDSSGRMPMPSTKTAAVRYTVEDLRREAERYLATATRLKHETDKLFNPERRKEEECKKGVVIGIESVLGFILAFKIADTERESRDRTGWVSILPLLATVVAEAEKLGLSPLKGLAHQLEGIVRDTVIFIDLRRLDRDPLAEDSRKPAPSDPHETVKEYRNRALEYQRQYQEMYHATGSALKAWHHGLTHLGLAEMMAKFPKTWAKRDQSRVSMGKAVDSNVIPNQYTRTFVLPMSQMTSQLEAVSFGLSILGEYCENEGWEWKPTLVL